MNLNLGHTGPVAVNAIDENLIFITSVSGAHPPRVPYKNWRSRPFSSDSSFELPKTIIL